MMAKTEQNPYDVLGVPRNATVDDATDAYYKQMKHMKSRLSCDAKCRTKKKELEKAMAFIDGSTWRRQKPRNKDKSSKETTKPRKRHERSRKPRKTVDVANDEAWDDWADFISCEWSSIMNSFKGKFSNLTKSRDDDDSGP